MVSLALSPLWKKQSITILCETSSSSNRGWKCPEHPVCGVLVFLVFFSSASTRDTKQATDRDQSPWISCLGVLLFPHHVNINRNACCLPTLERIKALLVGSLAVKLQGQMVKEEAVAVVLWITVLFMFCGLLAPNLQRIWLRCEDIKESLGALHVLPSSHKTELKRGAEVQSKNHFSGSLNPQSFSFIYFMDENMFTLHLKGLL